MSFLNSLMPHTAKLFKPKKSTASSGGVGSHTNINISESDTEVEENDATPTLPPPQNDENDGNGTSATSLTVEDGSASNHTPLKKMPSLPLAQSPAPILHPVHYESFHQPSMHQRCWTIKDFPMIMKYPKMLKPYKLVFDDADPPLEFHLGLSCSGTLFLKPVMSKKLVKTWASAFVKYGFSLGPHFTLGEDFTLYSPLLQIKHLNKSHLNVFEAKRITQSYLVDGNLNLIIRFVPYTPKTQPVREGVLGMANNSRGHVTVESCSQFSFSHENVEKDSEKFSSESEIDDDEEEEGGGDGDASSMSTKNYDDLDVGIKNLASETEILPKFANICERCKQAILPSPEELMKEEECKITNSFPCKKVDQGLIEVHDSGDEDNVPTTMKIKSKPLRRSKKSEFLRQKKQLWTHTASSPSFVYKMPKSRNDNSAKLNHTL